MFGRELPRLGLAAAAGLAAAVLLSACTASGSASTAPSSTAGSSSPASSSAVPSSGATGSSSSNQVTVPAATSASSSPSAPSSTVDSTASSTAVAPPSSVITSSVAPTTSTAPKPQPVPPPTVSASPVLGSTDLSPRAPITISAGGGTLAALTVTNAAGKVVAGALSADRKTWTLAEPLGYDATYTVNGQATGATGLTTKIDGTYSTITPDDVINASVSPGDGATVGIAAPILFSLGTNIDSQAGRLAIEKAIKITTVPATVGAFAWIQHDDGVGLDWRPQTYWKPGTKVTVSANLYGVDFGDNLWGKEDLSTSFTIGRSEITKGNIDTHRLQVFRDGKMVFDFPTSFGLESDPGRVTRGGTYIVMSKEYLHLMSNPKYHYFNFKAYYAVRISNNGTFIHANDGTDDIQGYKNETHGCANLSTVNAKAFYDQTMYGDPVEITGSSIPLGSADGDNHDWSIPWSTWLTLSAAHGVSEG